jgi:hypothetical protein
LLPERRLVFFRPPELRHPSQPIKRHIVSGLRGK